MQALGRSKGMTEGVLTLRHELCEKVDLLRDQFILRAVSTFRHNLQCDLADLRSCFTQA